MQVKLKVLSGSQAGKEISIKNSKFLIGRSDSCQLRPKSESISRKHCALVQKDGRLLALDLKSRNGTIVNDKKLATNKAKVLKDGDTLKVGQLEFQVLIEVGIGGAKKSEVKDVKQAAERIAASKETSDSRYEEVDISSWLDEADQVDRSNSEPLTRQFSLENAPQNLETITGEADDTALEIKEEEESRPTIPKKGKPKKLPKEAFQKAQSTTTAAADTLRKHFGGGR